MVTADLDAGGGVVDGRGVATVGQRLGDALGTVDNVAGRCVLIGRVIGERPEEVTHPLVGEVGDGVVAAGLT